MFALYPEPDSMIRLIISRFELNDCYKKNFVERANLTCKMPWSIHIEQWMDEFNITGCILTE